MQRQSLAIHLSLFLLLIFLFGGQIHSLSVDLPHHFAVVDELMKNGAANIRSAPNVGVMWIYPRLSHWLAAGLGHVVGSGLVAMWLVCILAIYGGYVALCWLAGHGGRVFALLVFVAVTAAATWSQGTLGFEIIVNFLYSQLVAFTLYAAVLVVLGAIGPRRLTLQAGFVLATAAVILGFHALPAVHLLGAFGIYLVLLTAMETWRTRAFQRLHMLRIAAYAVVGLIMLRFHPAMANMRELAQNDGSLDFVLVSSAFIAIAAIALGILAWRIWTRIEAREDIGVDILVLSALAAAGSLVLLQWLALQILGDGSFYAIKKHFFLLLTFSLLALARSVSPSPRLNGGWPFGLILIPAAAASLTILTLYRPGIPLYPIVRAVDYAEHAVRFAFPVFRPGNTVAFGETIPPVVRYMISVSTFQWPLAEPKTVSLIDSTFIPQRDAQYVMVERSVVSSRACAERYVETSTYVIVPSACLTALPRLPESGRITFTAGSGAAAYLAEGWWPVENWGVWSRGAPATVAATLPDTMKGRALEVVLTANAFLTASKSSFTADISINDKPAGSISFPATPQPLVVPVPADADLSGGLKIVFTPRDAVSPASTGHNADIRVLGIGLKSLEIRPR